MAVKTSSAQIYKEYQIAASTLASTAKLLAFSSPIKQMVILEAEGGRIIFKFGNSSVQADATLTSNALADGNFGVADGTVQEFAIPAGDNYVSIIMAAGGGTAYIGLANADM